jgi:TupA-like ATPgrasp
LKPRDAMRAAVSKLPTNLSRRALFYLGHGRFPRVKNPVTFNEKVNWRILRDRREIIRWTCDKLAMKSYAGDVHSAVNHGLRIPRTFWSGTDIRELANVELPKHWILKPNNRSGLVFFGHGQANIHDLQGTVGSWLRPQEGLDLHEWAYLKARPMLLAEELLGTPGSPPSDYKFYVFAGEVAVIEFHVGRYNDHRVRYYQPDWTPLEVSVGNRPSAATEAEPPGNLAEMIRIAGELGRPFDFIRVDLYSIDGEIFFGELTPYPGSGLERFDPVSFDTELGTNWKLPAL